jgi:hypothetical protein
MKQREAKRQIVREWDRWVKSQANRSGRGSARDSLKFFVELQDARPALLDFQSRGHDKWRLVHAWLLSERRVEEEIATRKRPRSKPVKSSRRDQPAPQRAR